MYANLNLLSRVKEILSDWQGEGYEQKPVWYDEEIEKRINNMSNVELLKLFDDIFSVHVCKR